MTIIQMDIGGATHRNGSHDGIDLVGPCEACDILLVGDDELLLMINDKQLPAYRLGGHVRFRSTDVLALAGAFA